MSLESVQQLFEGPIVSIRHFSSPDKILNGYAGFRRPEGDRKLDKIRLDRKHRELYIGPLPMPFTYRTPATPCAGYFFPLRFRHPVPSSYLHHAGFLLTRTLCCESQAVYFPFVDVYLRGLSFFQLVVPPWPSFNQHPVKWLPVLKKDNLKKE